MPLGAWFYGIKGSAFGLKEIYVYCWVGMLYFVTKVLGVCIVVGASGFRYQLYVAEIGLNLSLGRFPFGQSSTYHARSGWGKGPTWSAPSPRDGLTFILTVMESNLIVD